MMRICPRRPVGVLTMGNAASYNHGSLAAEAIALAPRDRLACPLLAGWGDRNQRAIPVAPRARVVTQSRHAPVRRARETGLSARTLLPEDALERTRLKP
jgi:hypothetical protein